MRELIISYIRNSRKWNAAINTGYIMPSLDSMNDIALLECYEFYTH